MDATASPQQIVLTQPTSFGSTLAKGLLAGAVLVGGGWWLKKYLRDRANDKATEGIADSVEKQQAIKLHNAMDGAGTNEKVIWGTLKQIQNWPKVVEEYKAFTKGGNLKDDLEDDLGAEETAKALNIIMLNKQQATKTSSTGLKIERGKFAVTKGAANVRRTARVMGSQKKDNAAFVANMLLPGSGSLIDKSNVVKLVPSGVVVGVLTGKTELDEKAEPDTVWFAEITTLAVDTKKELRMWVAVSQIETVTVAERQQRKIGVAVFHQAEYDNASSKS